MDIARHTKGVRDVVSHLAINERPPVSEPRETATRRSRMLANANARAEARLSGYRATFGSAVLAARLLAGMAQPLQDTESVLASRRLFSGGSRSMRGFGRRRLGPKDPEGEPLGGEAKLEASLEWRVPVLGRIDGAAFVDAAQVWLE